MAVGPLDRVRHQLASYSPIDARGLMVALGAVAAAPSATVDATAALLRRRLPVAGLALVGSGTEALVATLRLAERISGRADAPVALPAFGCFDLAAAAVRHRRVVGFYDVDPVTLGPDAESLRRVIADGAGTVVIASLYGVPIDWGTIDPILKDVIVVEDAAQGHGASWAGSPLGTHGRLGLLSFSRGKGWTGGAGGAVLVRDARDLGALDALRAGLHGSGSGGGVWGRAAAQWLLGRPAIYGLPRSIPALGLGETRYHDAPEPRGMAPVAARLLRAMTDAADEEAGQRRRTAERYRAACAGREGIGLATIPANAVAGYLRFPVLTPSGIGAMRDPVRATRLGVAPSYPLPLPRLPQLATTRRLADRTERWIGAETLAARLVTLPTHGLLTAEEQEAVLRAL